MVIFLLIAIAVGVLLLSEVGRGILSLCFLITFNLLLFALALAVTAALIVAILYVFGYLLHLYKPA